MKWKIEWENDIAEGQTPLEAAKICAKDISNGDSLCFTVTDNINKKRYSVDLNEHEGDEICEINE